MSEELTSKEHAELMLDHIGLGMVVPCLTRGFLTAFLVLGQKRKDLIYNELDINIFKLLSLQAGLAIENAMLLEETEKSAAQIYHEKKMRDLGEMGAGVGHNLSNRFNAISIGLGMAVDMFKNIDLTKFSKKEFNKHLSFFLKSMTNAYNDALRGGDIAKAIVRYSKKPTSPQPIPLEEVVSSSLNLLYLKKDIRRIKIKEDYPRGGPPLWASFSHTQDILFNFLDNAYDALQTKQRCMELGRMEKIEGFTPQITIKASNKAASWTIEIEDNGIGIKEEDIPKLFVPFHSTKASSEKGTGLGLHSIKRLLGLNQGTLRVKSTYAKGTTFSFTLPVATQEQIKEYEKRLKQEENNNIQAE